SSQRREAMLTPRVSAIRTQAGHPGAVLLSPRPATQGPQRALQSQTDPIDVTSLRLEESDVTSIGLELGCGAYRLAWGRHEWPGRVRCAGAGRHTGAGGAGRGRGRAPDAARLADRGGGGRGGRDRVRAVRRAAHAGRVAGLADLPELGLVPGRA